MIVYVLIGIVVAAGGVVGFLFYLFSKEAGKPLVEKIEPVSLMPDKGPSDSHGPTMAELEYKRRVDELEAELKEISEKGTMQASEALGLIDRLTKENQDLKMEKMQAPVDNEELIEAQKQADQLRQDNFLLSNQLEQAQAKVVELQDEAAAIRSRMEEDIKVAQKTIEDLKLEKEAIVLNRENSSQSSQSVNRELEEAKTQILEMQMELSTLRETNDKLHVSNENMFNQTQMFQQELMRQRAQVAGLERICENYRIQVEEKSA